jgi:hypothetical protein
MLNTLVLLFVCSASVAQAQYGIVGGLTAVNLADANSRKEAESYANFGLGVITAIRNKLLNATVSGNNQTQPQSGYKYQVNRVLSYQTQVVAGINYYLQVEIQSVCTNSLNCTTPQREICNMTIWERKWENFTNLTSYSCQVTNAASILAPYNAAYVAYPEVSNSTAAGTTTSRPATSILSSVMTNTPLANNTSTNITTTLSTSPMTTNATNATNTTVANNTTTASTISSAIPLPPAPGSMQRISNDDASALNLLTSVVLKINQDSLETFYYKPLVQKIYRQIVAGTRYIFVYLYQMTDCAKTSLTLTSLDGCNVPNATSSDVYFCRVSVFVPLPGNRLTLPFYINDRICF